MNKINKRSILSNPFCNKSIKERLLKSKAIDLNKNHIQLEENGYFKYIPIDKTKLLK